MAAQFVGLHMKVVLAQPAGYELNGYVSDLVPGSSLTLMNGTTDWAPQMVINATNIAALEQIPSHEQHSYYREVATAPVAQQAPPVQPVPAPLDDPAILSLGRSKAPISASTAELQSISPKGEIELVESELPGVLRGIHVGKGLNNKPLTPIQDVAESLNGLHIENGKHEESGKPTDTEDDKSKKKRRRRKNKTQSAQDSDAASSHAETAPRSGRGKGWRQTPMLQSTASFQPFHSLKRKTRGRQGGEDWESAEVTEEMGDFDFENNLAKFDKRTIFDQMRKDDQVDESNRLVSHNRRPKPGTNNGKNLHYTENVLEMPPSGIAKTGTDFWNSEADDGLPEGERLSGREFRGAAPLRRAESKNGVSRRSQSRKASGAMMGGQPLSRVNSAVSSNDTVLKSVYVDGRQQTHQSGLYLLPTNRRIEAISTLQMLNLENIAANEVGFTEDLMAENAGRGVAEVAVKALKDPAMKVRFELANSSSSAEALLDSSTTVILAGNNKSSVRALAAARHMRNRNIDVVICLIGIERERDLLEDLRRQIELYRSFGGKVLSKNEFFEHLRRNAASGAKVPVSLIIDCMLGLTISFEELRVGDQASVYELMEWANRNEAFVLAIDIPSGIDPTSGKIAIIDGSPLFVKPRYVVSIGAPKRGLVEAVTPPLDDEHDPLSTHEDDWRLFIADMGLGSAVWKKAGTKIRRGIDFDGNWVLEMEYRTHGYGSGER